MPPLDAARIAFAGTPEFSVPSLDALIAAGASVHTVLTQPDRPAGRGRRLTASPIRQLADNHGIDVWQPQRFDARAHDDLPSERPAVLVVVAYGLILPRWILDWPEIATINIHASLLPRWRGASPIQQAILAGDAETGVSIMRVEPGLDTGAVYGRRATPIGPKETAGELHDRLASMGASLLVELLPEILRGELEPVPQDHAQANYAPKISKQDAQLDWTESAVVLERCVRAYNPWPVAEVNTVDGERLRVWDAEAIAVPNNPEPGLVVGTGRQGIDVAAGSGALRLTRVQPPGGQVMDASAWLAGHDLRGMKFGRAV